MMESPRSSLYGHQPHQYSNIPVPTYPPQAFSNPSGLQFPDHPLDQVTQAPNPQTSTNKTHGHDGNPTDSENATTANSKGGSTPKGFGRCSSVYRVDEEGVKHRANAENFRDEVEERTRNGESCDQIADALIAKGAQVTAKSISRWRIQWGFRKRAVRKQSKPPKPKSQRINKKVIYSNKHKADITRMSQQGLSSDEIARIMVTRGMVLKKGTSTIARLQTVWQLRGTEDSRAENKRYLARRKARHQQVQEFQNYAEELGLENREEWVKRKMEEPAITQMRQEAAYKLMGDVAPKPKESKDPRHSTGPKEARKRGQSRKSTENVETRKRMSVDNRIGNTDIHTDDSEDDLSALPATVTARTLQSGRVSGAHNPIEVPEDSDSVSTDCEGELDHHNEDHDMDDGLDHGYQPTMERNDDDYDEDRDKSSDEDQGDEITTIQPPASTSQPSAGFTNASMAFIPPAEEVAAMQNMFGSLDGWITAAQTVKDLLLARGASRPAPHSLTGLPPSTADIETARRKLKDAAQAVLSTV
ncbi:hypothetical protein BJ170DRAFT_607260 [Xylariales sp. AK1849]|nr:hypothetical protein BJ170DRAFT_607260 [Xylariales sp. AK1849]